jgi:hypothetical protein
VATGPWPAQEGKEREIRIVGKSATACSDNGSKRVGNGRVTSNLV